MQISSLSPSIPLYFPFLRIKLHELKRNQLRGDGIQSFTLIQTLQKCREHNNDGKAERRAGMGMDREKRLPFAATHMMAIMQKFNHEIFTPFRDKHSVIEKEREEERDGRDVERKVS
jgi:hypothetical protein